MLKINNYIVTNLKVLAATFTAKKQTKKKLQT